MDRWYKLYHGDCLDIIPTLESKVDAIIADLPYGTTVMEWDSIIDVREMWTQFDSIIYDNAAIALFGNQPFTSLLVSSNTEMYRHFWIWEKNTATNICHSDHQPMRYTEDIVVFGKHKTVFNKQMIKRVSTSALERYKYEIGTGNNSPHYPSRDGKKIKYSQDKKNPSNIIYFPVVPNHTGKRLHPTQKPVALLEYLIKTYTNEGDTVLDPTMGSGTTGVACMNLDRNFIGIELNKGYFDIAESRIEESYHKPKQMNMFE